MKDLHEQLDPVEQLKKSLAQDWGGQYLYCRLCQSPVTSADEQVVIGLSHQHRFTNPCNITYTIGCYRNAPGCAIAGFPSEEFSWFGSYRWQIALCSHCQHHLGWYYQKIRAQKYFYGLISNRLLSQKTE
jgi:hypothetical protein